jgi:hypothetical protein
MHNIGQNQVNHHTGSNDGLPRHSSGLIADVSHSRISQLAAEGKENRENGRKCGEMEENGGKWGKMGSN